LTAPASPAVAAPGETGGLGVVHLKRFWSRQFSRLPGDHPVGDWQATHVLCSGLQIGLEETCRYLGTVRPDFPAFEAWVRERNGGAVGPAVAERINAALTDRPPPAAAQAAIRVVEEMPPVLSPEDLAHWQEQGWVVLREAISPEACRATVEAIWQAQAMSPDDPAGWSRRGPAQQCVFVQLFRHPALDANRRSLRIHKAFAQLWGSADLWMTTDRVGFNPPVRPDCPFPGPGIHWDVSLALPIPFGVQGILYLTDTAADQGAFGLVPGMHRTIESWVKRLPPQVNPNEAARQHLTMTPISGKAGDLIIWHHALPHGPTPNTTDRPRFVHYMTMFPARFGYNPVWR
jgi:hypothetical protein